LCRIGSAESADDFVLSGDSHALSLYEAFGEVARELHLSGTFTGLSGCPPLLSVHALRGERADARCRDHNERVYAYVKKQGIRKVVLAARWTYYTDGGYLGDDWSHIGFDLEDDRSKERSRWAFEVGVAETERRYREAGVELLWIMQAPQQKEKARLVYSSAAISRRLDDDYLRSVSIPLSEHQKLQSFVKQVFDAMVPASRQISFDELLCDTSYCPIGTSEASRYSDDDHLSREGARTLSVPIRNLLATPTAR
jgi:hypothetical protein